MNYLLIFLGGGLGSMARYGIWKLLGAYSINFPLATFMANALSSLILGFLLGLQLKGSIDDHSKLLLMIGFCGGFSTFSTFSAETLKLIQYGNYVTGISYIFLSVLICWAFIILGMKLS
jgi:CrcB protein